MNSKHLAACLLILSLAITAWLIAGSFVAYAPTVTATMMQNIYLSRIIRLRGAAAAFQFIALLVIAKWRSSV
jgi:hypothetical protein